MMSNRDLDLLRDLTAETPTTKMGQIRWAWPQIQAALTAGHTLRRVHQRLNQEGIEIGYRTLSTYIGRVERELASRPAPKQTAQQAGRKTNSPSDAQTTPLRETIQDPFANIRRERDKKKGTGFEYDPISTNKNLME